MIIHHYLLLFVAYVIGSIPSAVWLSKYVYKKDVREHGSKNAGATNTFRVLGKTAGVIVLMADILKGMAAVSLIQTTDTEWTQHNFLLFQLMLGFAATLGHIYSVFTRFKGGKGVATFTGVLIYIFPMATLICTIFFLMVFIISHYISLSSMLSALAFPAVCIWYYRITEYEIMALLLVIPMIVVYTHRSNIKRLWRGEENKMYLFKKSA